MATYPTAAEIADVPEYTAAQMLRWFKGQLLRISGPDGGHAAAMEGRSVEEATAYIESQIRYWQERADQEAMAASGGQYGPGTVLVSVVR